MMAKRVNSKMSTSSQKELGKTDDASELPPGWEIKTSKSRDGKLYYYNTVSGKSTWTHPHSASEGQGKIINEEKESKLKDHKSSDMKKSALSLISLHYTKQKDEPSSDFSQKRKAEKAVISSAIKIMKSKNTSSVHKSSIPEYVKHDGNIIQSEQNKTPTTIPPLIKKQNVKSNNSIDNKLQENKVNKKATKRSWCPVEVSTVGESVKDALKSYEVDIEEVSPPKKMAITRKQKNTLINDGSQNVSPTLDSVNKTVGIHGGNALPYSNKNIINDGSLISTTPVSLVVKNKKEEDGLNKKNIVSGPINSLHNVTIHQSSSVRDAKTIKQNRRKQNELSSYESLLNQSSSYENKLNSKQSCSQVNSHLPSILSKTVTQQISSNHVVQPHSLTHYSHNKNRSILLQDNSIVSKRSQSINTFAISNSPSRFSDPNKRHHSPLGNLLETSTTNSAKDFLDSEVGNSSLTRQSSPVGADVEQDIEDMEVDEETLVILSNLQDVRTQTSSAPDEPRGILTEIVTRAKPSGPSTNPNYDTYKGQLVLVVDTNVLIACLRFLQEALTFNIPVYGRLILVMPWVVMQELDCLKNRKSSINNLSASTSERASKAIRFIHSHLVNENPQLIGQTPVEASEETGLEIQCNDDRILQCCLQFQRKCTGSQVVLLTRDVNLSNKALIMGIKAASNETLWSHLKIPKPHYCIDHMNKEERNSTKGTSERIIPLESTKVNETTNLALLKLAKKCERWDSLPKVDTAKVLRNSATTQRTSSPLTVDCNLRETKLLSENANSVITKVTADDKRLPLNQAEKSVIMNKFETVWKLIYDMKLQLGTVVADGKSHANYNEAVQMLQVIIPLLSVLRNEFNRCLSLSPIILWDHEAELNSLCTCLNTFFMQAHTSYADPSQPVQVLQLIKYFCESGNRLTLLAGLEQLSVFVTEVEEIFKMCS